MTGDTRTLVSVTKEGGFVRSGPEVADEVHIHIAFGYLSAKQTCRSQCYLLFRVDVEMMT